jgi:DNA-binding NarL/FixJ family response regulator
MTLLTKFRILKVARLQNAMKWAQLPIFQGWKNIFCKERKVFKVARLVLSATQDRANVMKALDLGAMGYIPKSARNEVMLSALQLVFAGGIYIPPEILAREHLSQTAPRASGVGRAIVSPADLGLTDRQLDVLALMMQGKNNKSICRMLNLAEPTVKNHVTAILKALKVTNRTEAVIAVNEMGWKLPTTPKL